VAYNIGNGNQETSMLDLAKECARAADVSIKKISYNADAPSVGLQRCAPDVSRVRKLTNAPQSITPLSEGLETLVEWNRFLL
jgi:nucleoside-diphosphate-sugar epimerase